QADVVVDADEAVERPEAVPVEEAVVGGQGHREEDEGEIDEHAGAGEQRDLEPLAALRTGARRAAGFRSGGRARAQRGPGLVDCCHGCYSVAAAAFIASGIDSGVPSPNMRLTIASFIA